MTRKRCSTRASAFRPAGRVAGPPTGPAWRTAYWSCRPSFGGRLPRRRIDARQLILDLAWAGPLTVGLTGLPSGPLSGLGGVVDGAGEAADLGLGDVGAGVGPAAGGVLAGQQAHGHRLDERLVGRVAEAVEEKDGKGERIGLSRRDGGRPHHLDGAADGGVVGRGSALQQGQADQRRRAGRLHGSRLRRSAHRRRGGTPRRGRWPCRWRPDPPPARPIPSRPTRRRPHTPPAAPVS